MTKTHWMLPWRWRWLRSEEAPAQQEEEDNNNDNLLVALQAILQVIDTFSIT
jgi:hypothetical protein